MRQISRRMEMIHPTIGWRRDEHKTQNMHTARGFSDLYHVFARKQCILCSAVRHGCLTLLYVTSIWDFFCPWNNCDVLKKSANKLGWNACHCSLVLSTLIYSVIDFIVISSWFHRDFVRALILSQSSLHFIKSSYSPYTNKNLSLGLKCNIREISKLTACLLAVYEGYTCNMRVLCDLQHLPI